jgi:carboxymethylenebutenolidase
MLDHQQLSNAESEILALSGASGSQRQPSRRVALKAALGVGYAAAAAPIMAQTAIKTSSDGLTVGEITIDASGYKLPAYRAAPAGVKNPPVVLVIHEIFGVHEYIADTARRLAKAGYMAIAPELFARQGDAAQYGEMAKLMAEVVSRVPDTQVMSDLDATVAWAAANGGNTRHLGITGFCWGGRISWLYAQVNPNVKAGVAWYGRLTGARNAMNPVNPLDVSGSLKAPVLGLYGGADTGISQESVQAMQKALADAGATGNAAASASKFVVYPDTPHAFHADYRPSYRKGPAEDGWQRALAWFKSHGVA